MTDIDVMFVNDLSIPLSRFVNNFNLYVYIFSLHLEIVAYYIFLFFILNNSYASGSPIQVMVAQPFAHENFGEAIAKFVLLWLF